MNTLENSMNGNPNNINANSGIANTGSIGAINSGGAGNFSNAAARLAICAALLAIWIALVVFKVPGDEQIIDVIKYALAMLGGYHAGDRINAQASVPVLIPAALPASTINTVPQSKEPT